MHIPNILYVLHFDSFKRSRIQFLKSQLLILGVCAYDLAEIKMNSLYRLSIYVKNRKQQASLRKTFPQLNLNDISIKSDSLLKKDWLERWKKDFKQFSLTKEIDIVPKWKKNAKKNRKIIYMDTQMAFGTGLHETTRFMAQFIEDEKGNFKSVFDIGTGTGILAMVALIHGANKVSVMDNSKDAIQTAAKNFTFNGCKGVKCIFGDIQKYQSRLQYDLVLANLFTHDLIKCKRNILRLVKRNGLLGLSGVAISHDRKIRSAYTSLPLELIKQKKGKKWMAYLFRRT